MMGVNANESIQLSTCECENATSSCTNWHCTDVVNLSGR